MTLHGLVLGGQVTRTGRQPADYRYPVNRHPNELGNSAAAVEIRERISEEFGL